MVSLKLIYAETIIAFILNVMIVNASPKGPLSPEHYALLTKKVRDHFPELAHVTQQGIDKCFLSIDNKNSYSALFNPDAVILHIVYEYFGFFDGKIEITDKRMTNLMINTKIIINYVRNCSDILKDPHMKPEDLPTYKLGYTSMSCEDINDFLMKEPFQNRNKSNATIIQINGDSYRTFGKCDPNPPAATGPKNWAEEIPEIKNVRNQGQCGSCWAMTAVGMTEAVRLIKHQEPWGPLSPQYLVDFDNKNEGCKVGRVWQAAEFIMKEGLPLEETYPYEGRETKRKRVPTVAKISNYCHIEANENNVLLPKDLRIRLLEKYGPLEFYIRAGDPNFQNYKGDVYDPPNNDACGNDGHSMILVGYTDEYWIVKNSWGETWGNKGFINIARNKNICFSDHFVGYFEA